MIAKIEDCHTEIFLSPEEIKEYCKIGHGADTCVWLVVSSEGFECMYYNRPLILLDRWEKGETRAKRDGCNKVKNFHPFGKPLGKIEF